MLRTLENECRKPPPPVSAADYETKVDFMVGIAILVGIHKSFSIFVERLAIGTGIFTPIFQ